MQRKGVASVVLLFLYNFMMEFIDFSIMVWNIRGAVNLRGKRHTKELVRKYRPSLFVLLETHAQFDRARVFWNRLGHEAIAIEEASIMQVEFGCSQLGETLVLVYTSPVRSVRILLWNQLESLRDAISIPWLIMGNFNEVLSPSKVRGGNFYIS